jgi:dTDP-4-dehydrorhamnose reductase
MTAKINCAILGSTGMLGSMVLRYLSLQPNLTLVPTTRALLDATRAGLSDLVAVLAGCDYAINCIGIIKPRIDERNAASVRRAVQVNSLFPHALAEAAELTGTRVLQIAADCVYSGQGVGAGGYLETALHDPTDVYGKTKSLGESTCLPSPAVRHLRCSIIGPGGPGGKDSLLGWFLGQPKGATVKGYTNHYWNGLTTLAFARLCHGIMRAGLWETLPPVQHVVPTNLISKYSLLNHFARYYDRSDIGIEEVEASKVIDRTLDTATPRMNDNLWALAGYGGPAIIQQMVEELAVFTREREAAK